MTSDQQLYSTPDGSVWKEWRNPVNNDVEFDRIDSPNGSHEDDFRPQRLFEVLRFWGPLSLYDPVEIQTAVVTKALSSEEVHWWGTRSLIEGKVESLVKAINGLGYEIRRKDM